MSPSLSYSLSSMQVDSVQNKELLWTTLQESGAFVGLTREQFQPVQAAFDKSVQRAAVSMSGPLRDINKHIIRQFVQNELPLLRSMQSPNPNSFQNTIQNPVPTNLINQNNPNKKKKIEVVYRAEDLKNERASEFDRQLREKQAEMDSFLTLKKPTDVSFTDATADDDKPIGDEMSRLIAEELAARERELVQLKPEDIKRAQQWFGTSNNANELHTNELLQSSPKSNPNTNIKKSVSFSNRMSIVEEEHEMEQFQFKQTMDNVEEDTKFEEVDSIFSKFKKIKDPIIEADEPITTPKQIQPNLPPTQSELMQQLYDKLFELEQSLNAKHAEIMAYLNGLKH